MIDHNALIGGYPFRYVPHPDPDVLVRVLEREGLDGAWVGHLPSAFWRDPSPGNALLYTSVAPYKGLLAPVPAIRPDWPLVDRELDIALQAGSPAIRVYPPQWGLAPGDRGLAELAGKCGERGLVVQLTVRFEDLRQRHPHDVAGDLTAAAVRHLVRAAAATRILVSAASREMIEEVHWGLTPEEQRCVWWDISWIWGPPEDHLSKLLTTIGAERFVYGTQWPLRLSQGPRANLRLLAEDATPLALGSLASAASE
jgi:hypothetical protein